MQNTKYLLFRIISSYFSLPLSSLPENFGSLHARIDAKKSSSTKYYCIKMNVVCELQWTGSYLVLLFQSESSWKTFHVKMSLIYRQKAIRKWPHFQAFMSTVELLGRSYFLSTYETTTSECVLLFTGNVITVTKLYLSSSSSMPLFTFTSIKFGNINTRLSLTQDSCSGKRKSSPKRGRVI